MHAVGGGRLHLLPVLRPQYVRDQLVGGGVGHGAGMGSSVGDEYARQQPPVPPPKASTPDAETSNVEEKTVLQVHEGLRVALAA